MTAADAADVPSLLALARSGEPDALGRLLEQYRDYLTILARVQIGRRLQRKVEAGDLVQETFLEAHRAFERFRGVSEGELVQWLRQILAARVAMLVRRYFGTQRRNADLERELADELDQSSRLLGAEFVASGTSPSQGAARREQAVILADALARLPEDYRTVIHLRHLDGLTFPDVARRMGRSVDAVEKLWARALVQLRRLLPPPA
ncbi:MAG TPA: sigma-70 family RNA polymerase sigma factor [Gemmataceae bacterium]|jgi:RNA polymerase sigma-70 factor (ECF subfamily)